MKKLISLFAVGLVVGLWAFALLGDGVLQNVGGTTSVGADVSSALTNGQNTAVVFGSSGTLDGATDSGIFSGTTMQLAGYMRVQGGIMALNGTKGGANACMMFNTVSAQPRTTMQTNMWLGWSGLNAGSSSTFTNQTYLEQSGIGSVTVNTNLAVKGVVMWATNYVAANFTPVAGMVSIVASNGVLYKVTQLSTNLLSSATP